MVLKEVGYNHSEAKNLGINKIITINKITKISNR